MAMDMMAYNGVGQGVRSLYYYLGYKNRKEWKTFIVVDPHKALQCQVGNSNLPFVCMLRIRCDYKLKE